MNLGDPELELIDPTPNIYALFVHFDKIFFWAKLASRAAVRWSKRMYSCAGTCSYEGSSGFVDIALSEPLLKLRPRKDVVETLLHEMIHAYLFVTHRDQDRDGHGPNFKEHMYRINKAAGLNITIYHDFHDEVKLYQTHWWRCNGVCQTRRPHFGIVRRSSNYAPGPRDFWWEEHRRKCGGTFIKLKEPAKKAPKPTKSTTKPNADITKYITTNIKTNNNITKSILKDSINTTVKTKSNSSSTLAIPKKEPVFNPQYRKLPVLFEGKGQTLAGDQRRTKSPNVVEEVRNVWCKKQLDVTCTPDKKDQVTEIVRNVWAKKQLPVALTLDNNINVNKGKQPIKKEISTTNNHKPNCTMKSPPAKVKKIDDFFKATSILKDLYGDNVNITKSTGGSQKLIAVSNKSKTLATNMNAVDDKNVVDIIESVNCPICSALVSSQEINRHLDECLNKEVIEIICNETGEESAGAQALISTGQSSTIKPEITIHNLGDRIYLDNIENEFQKPFIKVEPGTSRDNGNVALISAGQTNGAFGNNIEKLVSAMPSIPVFQIKKEIYDGIQNIKPEIALHNLGDTTSLDDVENEFQKPFIKIEPDASSANIIINKCACCGETIDKPLEQHLDECLTFFGNNTTIPEEGASTSSAIKTIVIDDDDDIFDESLTLNATGTRVPCPCCLEMVEEAEMNEHLDMCLS